MRRIIYIVPLLLIPMLAWADDRTTVKEQMQVIHQHFGVNFVYDSSLALDIPYTGRPMKEITSSGQRSSHPQSSQLADCLEELFKDTGIEYEVMKKYIVLTKADSRKKPKDYSIFIEEQQDTLAESRITAIIDRRRNAAQTGLEHIDGSVFRRGFAALSAPDVIKHLQSLPGVSGGTELMSGLYVHGGTGNDNLFLYDGVPLYSASHLAGLYSSFNTDIVDNVNFFKSGFPASYGGRLSSVVEVSSRDGSMTGYKGSFTIGLINGSVQFEGPIVKDRTSFNVAMRRSWLDVLSIPGLAVFNAVSDKESYDRINVRYAMTDMNAKVTHRLSEDNYLRFGMITGQDALRYGVEDVSDEAKTYRMDYGFRWGNILGYIDWQNTIGDDIFYDMKMYYTQYRSRMNWDKYIDDGASAVYDQNESWLTGIYDVGIKADFDHSPGDVHRLRYGAEQIFHSYRPEQSWSIADNVTVGNDMRSGCVSASYFGSETALYAEDEMTLSERFTASLGLRYVLFGVKGRTYNRLEPRVALAYSPSDMLVLKASYTDMNQFSHRLVTTFLDLPSSVWLPSTDNIAPMHSRQFAAGAYLTLPFNLQVDLEGFYKAMDRIWEYKGYRLFPPLENWEKDFVEGLGRSYGVEASFSYNTVRTQASLNYTLSWSERFFEDIYLDWFPDRLDNRHRLNMSVSHRFTDRFEMYAGWTWHSGDRYTIESQHIPTGDKYNTEEYFYVSPNNARLPDYHRLDVGFNFHRTTKRGNESVWNLSIYNLYCRMNPMMSYIGTLKGKPVVWVTGVLPVIPTFSYTLKFKR